MPLQPNPCTEAAPCDIEGTKIKKKTFVKGKKDTRSAANSEQTGVCAGTHWAVSTPLQVQIDLPDPVVDKKT